MCPFVRSFVVQCVRCARVCESPRACELKRIFTRVHFRTKYNTPLLSATVFVFEVRLVSRNVNGRFFGTSIASSDFFDVPSGVRSLGKRATNFRMDRGRKMWLDDDRSCLVRAREENFRSRVQRNYGFIIC